MKLYACSNLSNSVVHPTKRNDHLFLLYDFTHNMKNMFNNFVSKKKMHVLEIADDQNIFGEKLHCMVLVHKALIRN